MSTFNRLRFFSLVILLNAFSALAQTPEWIWHGNNGQPPANNETRYFLKTFSVEGKPKNATLAVAADDEAEVYINGQHITSIKGWASASFKDVTKKIRPGRNVIAIKGRNDAADKAGILFRLQLVTGEKRSQETSRYISTDATWLSSAVEETGWQAKDFTPGPQWATARSFGKMGVPPWGDVIKSPQATRAEDLKVPAGFKVELLRSAQAGEGSWICMTVDGQGRLIISPQQDDLPLFRVTLSTSGQISEFEPLDSPIRQAMGLCWAHNSLYANAHGPNGTGLYRLLDKNVNGSFETNEVFFLKKMGGEGEHGYHAVAAGPDGMIYVMNGNHTKVPENISPNSPHRNYDEDFILPRQWDAGGHAVGILAPGGYVARTDPEGKNWELMLGGFRNSYDFDFNADGEMFTFDSDMEWEWGMPWYKPTRILHCVTGAEFGWRSGSAKWPEYYADSLPATFNIGVGSPTGTKFGTKSNYPEKYKRAFYAMDWSYGRIFAVHLTPKGASYEAESEVFVKGKPLNVTDLEFGKDGAMYFITGGRGTQAGLYRVSYVGTRSREPKWKSDLYFEEAGKNYRRLRQILESFHGQKSLAALEVAWPYMGHPDRFLRYAARIAIESQDVASWKDRAVNESDPEAGLNALLALARVGGRETQNELLLALKKFPFDSLTESQKLVKLRVIELSFIRQGKPDFQLAKLATEKLNRLYPSASYEMNRELCQLLIFLEAPDVVEKTFTLMEQAKTQEEQIHYIFALRNLKNGWTLEQRRKYFEWFQYIQQDKGEATYPSDPVYRIWADKSKAAERHPAELIRWFLEADREYTDGASFTKHLNNIKKDAIATLSENEKLALGDLVRDPAEKIVEQKPAKERKFVKEWQMLDLESALDQVARGRNFEDGKAAFRDSQCLACHRFGSDGGSVGPELTAASSKYSRRDILEAILDPSKVVSDQFQNETILKKDGDDVTGRVLDENEEKLVLMTNPLQPDQKTEVKKADIEKRTPSKLSPMPEGLLNNFTREEILNLLAYIESAGRAKADNFKKADERAGKK